MNERSSLVGGQLPNSDAAMPNQLREDVGGKLVSSRRIPIADLAERLGRLRFSVIGYTAQLELRFPPAEIVRWESATPTGDIWNIGRD